MSYKKVISNLKKYLNKLDGVTISEDLSKYKIIADSIKQVRQSLVTKTDFELKELSFHLKSIVNNRNVDESILIQAYALVFETIWRTMKIQPFDEQIIGALALHDNKLIEMQTGEGKTICAVFAAYLNALQGKGVHVLTFNDYLAQRDATWMNCIYDFLGVSVSYIKEGMSSSERKTAYNTDITYLTAKECGFDYLRDNLCFSIQDKVQRDFNLAIIDEADSILIDESRIPLVIADATQSSQNTVQLLQYASIVKSLEKNKDFNFDSYSRNIYLTEAGISKVENLLHCENLYAEHNNKALSLLHYALHAEYLLHIDKDYVIKNGMIKIVDENTGRIAQNRRWPDGLQIAVEAKENCLNRFTGRILNSISLQHLFRLYPRISGMTATAQIAEEEFRTFYNLHIVVIPPHKPCLRIDYPDQLYFTKSQKLNALKKEIIDIHSSGRPVLVGTQSVRESIEIANELKNCDISCQILNAKNDELEASIISKAGSKNAVTISTNMAGRGTDIKLGDMNQRADIVNLGGLHIIGTNRYESRRIDNQLRGRCARQGDPGSSKFFMSLEDDLYQKYRLHELLPKNLIDSTMQLTITNRRIVQEIDRIQRIIEGQNLEIKITLFKYTILLEQHRKIVFDKRNSLLTSDSFIDLYKSKKPELFAILESKIGVKPLFELCQKISLTQIDSMWSEYLAVIQDLRENIHLRRIGGQNPLFEFRKISIEIFNELFTDIDNSSIELFSSIDVNNLNFSFTEINNKMPSATWTYLVNDNPFERNVLIEIGTNIGLSMGSLVTWPILVLFALIKKFRGNSKSRNTESFT